MSKLNYIQEVEKELSNHINSGKMMISMYALLVLTLGEDTTLEDVHNAWAIAMNKRMPEHWSIIPSEQLKEEVLLKDTNFRDAIHKTTRILKERKII